MLPHKRACWAWPGGCPPPPLLGRCTGLHGGRLAGPAECAWAACKGGKLTGQATSQCSSLACLWFWVAIVPLSQSSFGLTNTITQCSSTQNELAITSVVATSKTPARQRALHPQEVTRVVKRKLVPHVLSTEN